METLLNLPWHVWLIIWTVLTAINFILSKYLMETVIRDNEDRLINVILCTVVPQVFIVFLIAKLSMFLEDKIEAYGRWLSKRPEDK